MFPGRFREDAGIVARSAANQRRTDSILAHCPQRFTSCRLTCLPRTVALAAS